MDNDATNSDPINDAADTYPASIAPPPDIQLSVRDCDNPGAPFRPLSYYLSQETAALLLHSRDPTSLEELDAQISCTGAIMKALQALTALKGRARNLFIPIATLPPEILCQVFRLHTYDPLESGYTVPLAHYPPLILSQVCSRWRSIVQDMPPLWGVLHCRLSSPAQSRHAANMINGWLGRAKGHPLSIKLDFEDEGAWLGRDAPCDIVDVLVSFSESWQEIHLTLPLSWFRPLRTLGYLGSLKTLKLSPVGPYHINRRVMGFYQAPRLSTLCYSAIYLRALQFPFAQITDATIDRIRVDEMLEFISICPSLTRFHFLNPFADGGTYPVISRTHMTLRELQITIQTTDPIVIPAHVFTDLLVAPLVRLVSWTLPLGTSDDPLVHIANFVHRSRCRLEIVEIFGPQLQEDNIVDFLLDFPHSIHVINR